MLDRTEMRKILMQSIVECSNPDFTEESISRGIDAGLEKIETTQIKRDGQKTFEVQAVPGDMDSGRVAGLTGLRIAESFYFRPVQRADRCLRWRG